MNTRPFMRFLLLTFGLFGLGICSYAQKKIKNIEKQTIHNRVIVNTPDSNVFAGVLPSTKSITPDDEKVYHWYKSDKIRTSRGGYDGKLLNGDYKSFYIDQNLKEKGKFKNGLKVGSWKAWYPNGELKEIYHWKKGLRHGKFQIFTDQHMPIMEGKYKKGVLKKRVKTFDKEGKLIVPQKVKKTRKWSWTPWKKKKAKQNPVSKSEKKQKVKPTSSDSTSKFKKFFSFLKPKKKQATEDPTQKENKKEKKAKRKEKKQKKNEEVTKKDNGNVPFTTGD